MAGIKHNLHGSLIPGQVKSFNHISDPFARHEAFMGQVGTNSFCSYCGKNILASSKDENNVEVNWEWEQSISMHTKCYYKLKAEQEMEKRREEENKESLEDIIKKQYGMDVRKTHE